MIQKNPKNMDEKGLSSIIGLGITVVVLLIAASIFISSLRSYQSETRTAAEARGERLTEKIQTDIKIENTVYYSADDNLKVKAKNIGSTVLETSKVQIFLDGEMVQEGNISSIVVNGNKTDIWAPEENIEVSIQNQGSEPRKVKLIADYGISDYYKEIENR